MRTIIHAFITVTLAFALICMLGFVQTATAQTKKVPVVLTLAKGYKLLKVEKAERGVALKANQCRAQFVYNNKKLKIEFPGIINDTLLYLKMTDGVKVSPEVEKSLGLSKSQNLKLKAGNISLKPKGGTDLPILIGRKE